jgi:hypothetical protein
MRHIEISLTKAQHQVSSAYRSRCTSSIANRPACDSLSSSISHGPGTMQANTTVNIQEEQILSSMLLHTPSVTPSEFPKRESEMSAPASLEGHLPSNPGLTSSSAITLPSAPTSAGMIEIEYLSGQPVLTETSQSEQCSFGTELLTDIASVEGASPCIHQNWGMITEDDPTQNRTSAPSEYWWTESKQEETGNIVWDPLINIHKGD